MLQALITHNYSLSLTACSHICATKSIHTSGNYDFDWKGYGFKMHVPENALPAGETECVVRYYSYLAENQPV